MVQVAKHGLVEQFIPHPPVDTFHKTGLHRLARRDVMPLDPVLGTPAQDGVRSQFRAVSLTVILGFPRHSIRIVSSRATRRPDIDVSGIAARHSRVTSSTTLSTRKRWPLANWSWTKSSDQRALARASTRIGARVPTALRRAFRLRDHQCRRGNGPPDRFLILLHPRGRADRSG